ncbi:MAG: AI-2E family transporter [Candidatus Staskawiczbacteria bacterium]|nr:AI-2E family transporter [Candidatus Staskawiczbacteria bacterium]
MSRENTLDISWEAIIKVFIAIFIFYIIYLVREIALWFLFALAISVLLDPAINALRKIKIPKIISVVIVYLSIFGIVGLLIYLSAPIFISELKQFSQNLPGYFEQINPVLRQFGIQTAQDFDEFVIVATGGLQQSSESIIKALMVFFGGVLSTVSILTFSFFLSLEDKGVERALLLMFPQRYENQIRSIFEKSQRKVSGWFGARLIACLFVGIASYIIFYLFGIQYALILALISGILNFIPYIGPWITTFILLAFIAVSSGSWLTVIYVLAAIVIIQEVENKLLTPLLMKKMTDLPAVLVLMSMLIGGKVFGFTGLIFAVPVAGIIYEFLREFLEKKRDGSNVLIEE